MRLANWNETSAGSGILKDILLFLGLFLLVFLALRPYQHVLFTCNEGIFSGIAREMDRGAVLYQDVWDHKPPLIFQEYRLIRRVFGSDEAGLHAGVMLVHCLDAILLFLLARRLGFEKRACWLTSFLYVAFLSPPFFEAWTGQADLFMQPFLMLSFWLALGRGTIAWFGAGLCWAAAFFTKQSALLFLPVFFTAFAGNRRGKINGFIVGMDLASLCVAWPFIQSGQMALLWEGVAGFNGAYVQSGWHSLFSGLGGVQGVTATRYLLPSLCFYGLPLLACLAFSMAKFRRGRIWAIQERGFAFTLVWFFCALASCAFSGLFLQYYFVVLLPPLALFCGLALTPAFKPSPAPLRTALTVLLFLSFLYLVLSNWGLGAEGIYQRIPEAGELKSAHEAGATLAGRAGPGDALLAWSEQPQVYVYSGLRVFTAKAFFAHHYFSSEDLPATWMKKFSKDPPRFVAVSRETRQIVPEPGWLDRELGEKYSQIACVGTSEQYEIYELNKQQGGQKVGAL